MFMNIKKLTVAATAAASFAVAAVASAADITGAGATFPYPIYAKWAAAYHQADRHRPELPVDRLGRRHQADQRQDRRFRRLGHAAQARSAREERPDAVPDRDGRRRAGRQHQGHQAGRAQAHRRAAGRHLPRQDHQVERSGDRHAQPRREAAEPGDHRGAPLRRLGHDLHLHELPVARSAPSGRTRSATARRSHWPAGVGGKGNEGVATYVQRIDGSIGYVEYAYALQNHMAYVKLKNRDGNFVAPDRASRSWRPPRAPTGTLRRAST